MRRRIGLIFVALSAMVMMAAANMSQKITDPVLAQFELTTKDTKALDAIVAEFEIVNRNGDTYQIIAPAARVNDLRKIAPSIVMTVPDLRAEILGLAKADPTWLDSYRSFDEVEAEMFALQDQYPSLVQVDTYGESARGRPLYVLKLSDQVEIDEDEPELMLTSATHGDELITVEVTMDLLSELLAGYGTDERLTAMIDDHELFFIPVVNPDGFTRQSRYANGTDPNRDYPWPESPNVNSVACIDHIIQFFHSRDIQGSLDFHASGQMVMWPWAYTYDAPVAADEQALSDLGFAMAADNRYRAGQISRIIYVAKGSSADYYYWQKNSLSYGIELARSKVPHPSQIADVVDEAREMTWKFIEAF